MNLRKVLLMAALVEVVTGLALLLDPAVVAKLLLGVEVPAIGMVLGRCFGIALLALGVACWPVAQVVESRSAIVRGMLIYNALSALYLGYLATAGHAAGVLLWPAIVLHAVVASLLLVTTRDARRSVAATGL